MFQNLFFIIIISFYTNNILSGDFSNQLQYIKPSKMEEGTEEINQFKEIDEFKAQYDLKKRKEEKDEFTSQEIIVLDECPLHRFASDGNNERILEYLPKYSVDVLNPRGKTPLYFAVVSKKMSTIKLLISKGANKKIIYTMAGINDLLKRPDYAKVKEILDCENLDDQNYNKIITNYIKNLIEKNQEENVLNFLDTSSDVNVKDENNKSPIYYAIKSKNKSIVKKLLSLGAKVDLSDPDIKDILKDNENKEIYDIIKQYKITKIKKNKLKDKTNILFDAIDNNNPEEFTKILFDKFSKFRDKSLKSYFVYAISINPDTEIKKFKNKTRKEYIENLIAILNCLIQINPELINVKDRAGQTILHDAVAQSCSEVISFLVTNGIDLDSKNREGLTPIHLSVKLNKKESVETLLKFQPNLNVIDNNYQNVENYVENCNNPEIIKLFPNVLEKITREEEARKAIIIEESRKREELEKQEKLVEINRIEKIKKEIKLEKYNKRMRILTFSSIAILIGYKIFGKKIINKYKKIAN